MKSSLLRVFLFFLFSSQTLFGAWLSDPEEFKQSVEVIDDLKEEAAPLIEVTKEEDKTALIRYNLAFFKEQADISFNSSVPFTLSHYYKNFNAKDFKSPDFLGRSYPRLSSDSMRVGSHLDDAPSLGGKRRLDKESAYTLAARYNDLYEGLRKSPYIFADLLILHKRRLVKEVGQESRTHYHYKNFILPDHLLGQYQYPLLCVYFTPEIWSTIDPGTEGMGFSRFVQAIFTALLNHRLASHEIHIETVAREGFGGVIPSTSDLGDGFRLDIGLLPKESIPVIANTLSELDLFISTLLEMRSRNELNGFLKHIFSFLSAYEDCAAKLATVDRIIVQTALYLEENDSLKNIKLRNLIKKTPPEILEKLKRARSERKDLSQVFEIHVEAEAFINSPLSPKRKDKWDGDGYGSSSEEELDGGSIKLQKFSFVSGMAALNLMDFTACRYSIRLFTAKPEFFLDIIKGPSSPHYPYFELATLVPKWRTNLLEKNKDKMLSEVFKGIHHWNPAPNPRNISGTKPHYESLVEIIDVTNLTTVERTKLIHERLDHSNIPDKLRSHRVLFLVSSGSKHPTGGDLVYGEAVIAGSSSAVASCQEILRKHLEKDRSTLCHTSSTVLQAHEHHFRRTLKKNRLRSGNRDLRRASNYFRPRPKKRFTNTIEDVIQILFGCSSDDEASDFSGEESDFSDKEGTFDAERLLEIEEIFSSESEEEELLEIEENLSSESEEDDN